MTTRLRTTAMLAAFALLLAPFGVFASGGADSNSRRSAPLPFEPAEHLVYEGEFTRSILRGIKIAEFNFTAGRATPEGKAGSETPMLALVGDVKTEGWFHRLFNIDFHFRMESLVEREDFRVLRTKTLDEQGKRVRTSEAVFDRAAKQVSWTETDPNNPQRPPRVVSSPIEGTVHDILSGIYYLRTRQFAPGQSFEMTLSDAGQVYRVPVTVAAEPKPLKTVVGRVAVVRLDVGMFGEGRPIEGDGTMSIWVTTDSLRIPVRARMSSRLGLLDIKLKRYSNGTAGKRQK